MTGLKLFDLHCDTVYECYRRGCSLMHNPLHVDVERGWRYAPWCQVFAVWIPDTVRGEEAWRLCRTVLAYAKGQADAGDGLFRLADTASELRQAIDEGVPVGLLGVEGGAALGGKVQRVAELAARGVRVMTLTWNGSCELGHGCLSANADGLTAVGKQVLAEMEKYAIVPDVSHLNEAGFWDVAAHTVGPFIASHSVSKAVHEHPRNLTDAQFAAIRDRGGLVGVTACGSHLGEQSMERLYRHVDHFLERDGADTVALGFDLDGTDLPPSWNGIAAAETFAEYLLSRRIHETVVEALCFDNAYRFFSRILPR